MWEALYGNVRPVELACFETVIDALRRRCPTLNLRVHTSVARAVIPHQPGLRFDIHIALSNRDELHLRAAGLKCRWVACGEPGVTEQFIESVLGLMAGQYRIVLTTLFGKAVACKLQRPVGRNWQTVARQDPQRPGLLWLCRTRIVVNTAAQRRAAGTRVPRLKKSRPQRTMPMRSRSHDAPTANGTRR